MEEKPKKPKSCFYCVCYNDKKGLCKVYNYRNVKRKITPKELYQNCPLKWT